MQVFVTAGHVVRATSNSCLGLRAVWNLSSTHTSKSDMLLKQNPEGIKWYIRQFFGGFFFFAGRAVKCRVERRHL